MGNSFDSMKRSLFDLTTATFGYSASWGLIEGKIHYRHPNENESLTMGIAFSPTDYFMEYKGGDFPGLYEAVRNGQDIVILIEGQPHLAMSVRSVSDGDTYQVHLEKQ